MALLVWAVGCAGGSIFHDKAKNNRDTMRYSNLSNNMMTERTVNNRGAGKSIIGGGGGGGQIFIYSCNLVPRAFPFLSLGRREKALAPGGHVTFNTQI